MTKVAVTSRSFSRHPILKAELRERYPAVTFNDGDSLRGDDLIRFLKGHDAAITALEPMNGSVFDAVPELRVLSKYGVGLDMIDIPAMRDRGIKLGWTGGMNRRAVTELVISMAIGLLRHVPNANSEVRSGVWRQHKGREISGRTVGIIGCGNIGKDLAALLRAFGCRVLANDIRDYSAFYEKHGIEALDIETLLTTAEIVTLHLPLDDSTRGILDAGRLALMREDAILINCARGHLVDEAALKSALQSGRLAAAGFDVFATEPPEDAELLSLPNFLATPHIGGSSEEAILAMGRAAIAGLESAAIPNPNDFIGV